jgi:hypothetical protein
MIIGGTMRSVLSAVLMLGMCQAMAGDATQASLAKILNGLAPPDYTPQAFIERRQNRLLAEPMVFHGEVQLSPDGTFSKTINDPFHERVLVTNDFLELERDGKTKRVSLRRERGARGLYIGLRAFLERDIDALLSLFEVAAIEPGSSWRVELVPVDAKLERYVTQMVITGEGPDVASIRTTQAESNWQEMLFGLDTPP